MFDAATYAAVLKSTPLLSQRILRAAARAIPAQVMGSPPTVIINSTGCTGIEGGSAVGAGGASYTVGDIFNISGGTLQSGGAAAQGRVTSVSGGVVTGWTLVEGHCGEYTFGNGPSGTVGTTKVTGSGNDALTVVITGSSHGSPVNPGKLSTFGSQQVLVSDPRISQLSGVLGIDSGNPTNGYRPLYISKTAGSASFIGGQGGSTYGAGIGFATDSQYIDFNVLIISGVLIGYLTDLRTGVRQRWQAGDIAVNISNFAFIKVDFGSSAPRYIELYFNTAFSLRGIDVMPTATLWKHQPSDAIKAVAVHDSYGEGQAATNRTRASHVYAMGELLGATNIINSSVAGTGAVATAAGVCNNYLQRIQFGNIDASFIGTMDIVFLFASVNDRISLGGSNTAPNITAAWTSIVQAAAVAQPSALIIVFGPPNPSNLTAQADYDAVKAGVQAAQGSNAKIIYIDTSPIAGGGDPILTGTGNVSSLQHNGNSDFYVTADTIHPNDAGYAYIGAHEASLALNAIRALAA